MTPLIKKSADILVELFGEKAKSGGSFEIFKYVRMLTEHTEISLHAYDSLLWLISNIIYQSEVLRVTNLYSFNFQNLQLLHYGDHIGHSLWSCC